MIDNNEIEKRLASALNAAAPDMLDDLMAELDITEKPEPLMRDKLAEDGQDRYKKAAVRSRTFRTLISCAAALILMVGGVTVWKNINEKVFAVVDLLALLVGAQSYGSLTRMQAANDKVIMTSGPIVSSVRATDSKGGVAAGNGPEGRSLVLIEQDNIGTYETRIYLYQGHIVQEYALGGAPYTPERATVLSESETFSFSFKDGLLSIETDAGVSQVALRNMQGGE